MTAMLGKKDNERRRAAIDLWLLNAPSSYTDSIYQITPYLRSACRRPTKRRQYLDDSTITMWLFLFAICLSTASAAFIQSFEDCLPDRYLNTVPPNEPLQWQTLWVDAKFNRTAPSHNLNITIYGNVSGQAIMGPYPPSDSPQWSNPADGFGKIVNISNSTDVYTTLYTTYNVLTYTPYDAPASPFCKSTTNTVCPIGPRFHAVDRPSDLPAFSIGHDLNSTFAFSTIIANARANSGDEGDQVIVCVSAYITPALGTTIAGVLAYVPVAILVLVAVAVILASTYSPWGTLDPFRWTSNWGRDEDLLRLVTPGFGDCLQYIQFIVLSGSLSLAYPGFYQPAVSQVGWSALMFNESFVSNGNGTPNPVDGIYVTNSTYGMTRMSQLIGMSDPQDMWAGVVIWTLVIIAIVVISCQLGFFARSIVQKLANNPSQDLRSKNWPFTGGNLVRIVCNFFILPIVSLSMFQLVIASDSQAVVVAFAVILLAAILLFAGWILRLIFRTKHRSHLFDDLPTVLLYGPLYNTYSDDAATFALIPLALTFLKGVAIGAVQQSGIAQLVILAVCEVVLITTLHAFRPFQSPTSMNAIHTIFAVVRLTTVLLLIAFTPSLGVAEGTKGWIGYVVLLLHGLVLIFGFFLNAVQAIIEVIARLLGVGGGPASRGGFVRALGVRQLSKRQRRPSLRHSQHSTAAMLADDVEAKSVHLGERSRSLSASSAIMLNSHRASDARLSAHLDRSISGGTVEEVPFDNMYSYLPATSFSAAGPRRPELTLKTEPADPYYRPPRQRRHTGDLMTPGAMSRDQQTASGEWAEFTTSPDADRRGSGVPRTGSGSPSQQLAPAPTYLRAREGSDANADQNKDYAVREVDYYYGVRGPALSSQPTRKLKTGPADPVGPVSSATGWFRGMFGGKKKESGKGFEVVRSSRMPPPRDEEDEEAVTAPEEPYTDGPPLQQEPYLPGEQSRSDATDRARMNDDEDDDGAGLDEFGDRAIPERPPSLDPLDVLGGGLGIPSRWSSLVSRRLSDEQAPERHMVETRSAEQTTAEDKHIGEQANDDSLPAVPSVPRKSSKRTASTDAAVLANANDRLSAIADSPARSLSRTLEPPRVPFSNTHDDSSRRPSVGAESVMTDDEDPAEAGTRGRSGSAALRPMASTSGRPTSYGHVNQFRASDSIHAPGSAHAGSSAEMIDGSPRRSREGR